MVHGRRWNVWVLSFYLSLHSGAHTQTQHPNTHTYIDINGHPSDSGHLSIQPHLYICFISSVSLPRPLCVRLTALQCQSVPWKARCGHCHSRPATECQQEGDACHAGCNAGFHFATLIRVLLLLLLLLHFIVWIFRKLFVCLFVRLTSFVFLFSLHLLSLPLSSEAVVSCR